MIKREIEPKIKELAKQYGVISISGPRQSGKTTLAKKIFPKHEYINFENLQELEKIKADPKNFIDSIKKGIIIDEAQKYPDILSYIQISIDENYIPGKFIITGSQNLLLLNKVSQSLAGRVALVKLLPLNITELKKADQLEDNYIKQIFKGFYPAIYDKNFQISEYYNNYISTYIERDVRTIKNIGDLSTFSKFMQVLATRIGQILNLSDISAALGISYNTINSWISILEASYIVFILQPHFKNLGKRIIKSPKIYFTDIGLATHLLRLDTEKELSNYYALGSLFENMVIVDIYKDIINQRSSTKLFFFRDKTANEVDLLIDKGIEIEPVEIKSSKSFNKVFLKGIQYYNALGGGETGSIIYTGEESWNIQGIKILNYKDLSKIKFQNIF
jgi:hypothetical protein